MNINNLKQIILNMATVYKLVDKITDEQLDREVEDTLLDVSVAIILLTCRADVDVNDIILDKQLADIIHRARTEIERQGLSFAQVITHKPDDIYVDVMCEV